MPVKRLRLFRPRSCRPLDSICGERRLNRVPKPLVDDRLVLARIDLALVADLAAVETVLQQRIKRAAGELLATTGGAVGPRSLLAPDPGAVELVAQRMNRLQREIALENVIDNLSLALIDDEPALLDVIAERRHAAHPHAFFLRGGDLVAHPLSSC
jgi:hypothetical protein